MGAMGEMGPMKPDGGQGYEKIHRFQNRLLAIPVSSVIA
jgi:hypothetical protein